MPLLARELLARIADYCESATLARLSRTSKLLYSLAAPRLYRCATLTTRREWQTYTQTWSKWLNPWVRKPVGEGKIQLWEVQELTLQQPLTTYGDLPRTFDLPDLTFLATSSIFSTISHLTLRNIPLPAHFFATLLPPKSRTRTTLKVFCIDCVIPKKDEVGYEQEQIKAVAFVLQALDFLPHEYYVTGEYPGGEPDDSSRRGSQFWENRQGAHSRCSTPSSTYSDSDDSLLHESVGCDCGTIDPTWLSHAPYRSHGLLTYYRLECLTTSHSTSEAIALFSRLFHSPSRRMCDKCLDLPPFISSSPASSSPFSNLTRLEWQLVPFIVTFSPCKDGPPSRYEDLLILLGTDIIRNVKEFKLRGFMVMIRLDSFSHLPLRRHLPSIFLPLTHRSNLRSTSTQAQKHSRIPPASLQTGSHT
ncbi:hypothetical protein JCM11641_007580 [Rhodosporidiobolus odoratus]